MPIPVECRSCGHRLKAKDASAGKKIRCPECDEPIPVPAGGPRRKKRPAKKRPEPEYDENADLDFGALAAMERRSGSLGSGDVEPCPECGEPVGRRAAECPHCEADLEEIRADQKREKKIAKRKKMMAESREGGLPKNFNQILILGVLAVFAPLALHVMLADPLLPPAPSDFKDMLVIPAELWEMPEQFLAGDLAAYERELQEADPHARVGKNGKGNNAIYGQQERKSAIKEALEAAIAAQRIPPMQLKD